jgi:hypothetical protein
MPSTFVSRNARICWLPAVFIRNGLVMRQQKTQQRCCEFNSAFSRSTRSRYAVRQHAGTPILVIKHIR